MKEKINIVWFKRDLRIHDHMPLYQASIQDLPVIPLYIVEPGLWRQPFSSDRHWNFIRECLITLRKSTQQLGQPLVIREGEAIEIFNQLSSDFDIKTIFSHEETGNLWIFKRDLDVIDWCNKHAINFLEYPSNGVVRRLKSRDAWFQIRNQRLAEPLTPKPNFLKPISSIEIAEIPDEKNYLGNQQIGGRSSAIQTLKSFLDVRGRDYIYRLSTPRKSDYHCSRLSPHLAWGTLSTKEVLTSIENKRKLLNEDELKRWKKNYSALIARLSWRCHFMQKMESQPDIEFNCMHPAFEGMREPEHNAFFLEHWKNGNTGYPLVDAAMRQLITEGWITFRMRAMLVSFASYHLWLDWRQTANYLAQLFTDFEPGIHYSQMQMQSGVTGINTLRIYNPIKQSQEKDPEGFYIKQWIPELRKVPSPWIHQPWLMPKNLQIEFDCIIGINYPEPLVDHALAIKSAREKISVVQKQDNFRNEANNVYKKLGSRKKQTSKKNKSKKKLNKSDHQMSLDF